jgi:hypothetical protein
MADLEIAGRTSCEARDMAETQSRLAVRGTSTSVCCGRRLTRVPQLLLDEAAETLVEEVYGDVSPLVVNTYKNYAPPVLKADLLRYLLLYRFGGLYADADVTCVRNISSWLPADIWNNDSVHTVLVFPSMHQPVSQHVQCGHRDVSWVLVRPPTLMALRSDHAEASQSQMNHWEWSRPYQVREHCAPVSS